MKKLIIPAIFAVLFTCLSYSQQSVKPVNPSYKYVASPGFVNITDISGATITKDSVGINSKYYFGITNVFGYQIDRNFFGGIGVGYHFYDKGQGVPLFLEYKYSTYLKRVTPYFFGDGGITLDPGDLKNGSKIFINPGIGISRTISSRIEVFLAAGIMIQKRTYLMGASYVNFRLGIIFRKNSFRLFKP